MLELRPYNSALVIQAEPRIPALDGLRGIAIMLVMVYHQTLVVGPTLIDRAVGFWTMGGWAGVDLFFVLSGFLITGILLDSKGAPGYFRNFYARRVLRIFPLYYAVVAFSLLILPQFQHAKLANFARIQGDEWWYWLYLSNILDGIHHTFRHGILDVSWSLSIEEQFYVVWPLLVFLVSRRALAMLCGFLLALAVLWRISLLLVGADPITVFVLTPGRLDGLAVGALIAIATRTPSLLIILRRVARPAGAGALLAVLGISSIGGGFDPYTPAMQTAGYLCLAIAYGAILFAVVSPPGGAPAQILEWRPLRVLGKYSYALYLFHLPLRALIRDTVYGPDRFLTVAGSPLPGQLLFYVAATLLTLLAAWLSWNLYEKHFLALKRFFVTRPHGRRSGATPAVQALSGVAE